MAWGPLGLLSSRSFGCFIALAFLVDIAVCLGFHLLATSNAAEGSGSGSSFYDTSTWDVLACCAGRLILFPALSGVALCVYRRTAAFSPLVKLQTNSEGTPGGSERQLRSFVGGHAQDLQQPLTAADSNGGLAMSNGHGVANGTSHSPSDSSPSLTESFQSAFEMKRDHVLFMKKADWQRDIIMSALFLLAVGMSSYNGIKCVSFDYSSRTIAVEGPLLASVIFWTNLEYFMLRALLHQLTAEQGELIQHIHLHPLFFETGLKCHGCDVCHESMKGPHYIAYRCRTCDFDLCPRCYKQKDKPTAKGYGARAIRKNGEQVTTWTYFKRIVELAMDFWKTLSLAIFCLLVNQGLVIWAPSVQGSIFDAIIGYIQDPQGQGKKEFERMMMTYLLVNVLTGFFSGMRALAQELVMRRISCIVRTKLFQSIIRMDISFFDTMHTGQLTSRLSNDSSQMVSPLQTLINDLLANLLLLGGGMIMAFKTSWKLSILALTIVPPITYCYRQYAQWARKVNYSIYCAYGEAQTTATEAIQNIRTVRGFSTEAHEAGKFDDSISTALKHGIKNAYVSASVTAFSTYMNLGTAVLILWYGGTLVCESHEQAMTTGMLITFQLYWNMMNNAFISLGNVFNDLIRSSSAAERVFSIIDARPEVDPDEGEQVRREDVVGRLELRGVKFFYATRPQNVVLNDINMKMEPGTTTALVGKSGGGKSTLLYLLMRFYEATDGMVMLDGKDMRTLSSRSVRQFCGFVQQDTQLFACSIEENLTYGLGRPHTKEEVIEACQAANAHEFIMEMEEQYETRTGEKGVMLSGGQRQRLAIARCFLRQPKLLFLDEATSALDAENEGLVQLALDQLLHKLNSTVVLIAHRLSTVIDATQICVVHKGRIVERGSHGELMETAGIYSALVQRQMARDASTVMDQKAKASVPKKGTEIDDLIEDLEQSGKLNLDQ